MKTVVNSAETLEQAIEDIVDLYKQGHYLRISVIKGRDRSLEQNNLYHRWISKLVEKHGEFDIAGYKRFCKLHFFVPVLREECEEFAAVYDAHIKPMAYPDKIEMMDIIPITSTLTVQQMSKGLDAMQKHFASLATNSVTLESGEKRLRDDKA